MASGKKQQAVQVHKLAEQLRPAFLRIARHLRREAQRLGLSALDAQLLGLVWEKPGIGVSELAELEHMSRPAMSAHMKRLVDAGWIARQTMAKNADRRHVGLVMTDEGNKVLAAIIRQRGDWLAARLSALSPEHYAVLEAALEPLTIFADSV